MNTISFDINNGRKLVFEQAEHDGNVIVKHIKADGEVDTESVYAPHRINVGQFVMLYNLYKHIMNNDIQNDFINPNGKNKEE